MPEEKEVTPELVVSRSTSFHSVLEPGRYKGNLPGTRKDASQMDEIIHKVNCMNDDVARIIKKLSGEPCLRKEVGRMKSLSLGFGSEAERPTKPNNKTYRAWELGTYRSAWRVVQGGIVLCGSQDAADPDELNIALESIDLDRFASLQQLNDLDIRMDFFNGVAVEFFATMSDDDEYFHVFCPENVYIEVSVRKGWKIGRSDKPWYEAGGPGSRS
jgi:hypothetical protein